MATDPVATILKHISKGTFDEQLEVIGSTVWARRKFLQQVNAQEMRASLSIGDRVRLKTGRPKYLVGRTGEVTGIESKGAAVHLDDGRVRRYGPVVVCPYGMLEKL